MVKRQELETVIEAIKSRRTLCENDIKNLEETTINELKKIFPSVDINALNLDDITALSLKDRSNLIKLVGLEDHFFNFDEENSYLELFKLVNDFVKRNKDRIDKFNEVLLKCDMYNEVLTTNSKNHDLLPNVIDFSSFLDSLGSLSDHDKQVALRRVNEYNVESNILDPEIRQGVNYMVSEINQHQDVKDIILN